MAGKKRPRSAIPKKIRGLVIMVALTLLKVEIITTAAISPAPAAPRIGIRSTAVEAISRDWAISGTGTR